MDPSDNSDHPRASESGFPEVVLAEDLITIDVSGGDGRDGRDATSYAGRSAPRGRSGRRGGDARPAEPGQHAGDIEISLRSSSQSEGVVELAGRTVLPRGDSRPIRASLVFGDMGSIRLVARGGKGGDGGRGGDGESGGKGDDGADATRDRAGEVGGPGGDGGDGGNGTSGQRGGSGGRAIVRVDARDTHLLMLLKHEASGGDGGSAGANGRGGAGGPGGDGGRPYSWTTTSTEYVTDAEGKTHSRTVTHHHRNRGGTDGPPGRTGRDGQAVLVPGSPGQPGNCRIFVEQEQGVAEYLGRYEVEIVDYELTLQDQIAEPTSAITVSQLRVRNKGGMPTPTRYPVVIELADARWIQSDRQSLRLPDTLEPGEEYVFDRDTLSGRVPDIDTVPVGAPLHETERCSPIAVQTGVNRRFDNLHPRQEFDVSFPGEIDFVASLESQTPGRAARLVTSIVNRSRFDLGRQSTTKRFLGIHVSLENLEMADPIVLVDLHGNRVSWDRGFDQEIDCLKAGEEVKVETIVGVLPGAPGYTKADISTTLRLGQLGTPELPRDRHRRVYSLRIAQAYAFDPTADILVVTNHGTTTEELQAWINVAERLSKKASVWDISLNDALSLSDILAHGQSLLRDFHGKSIVLCNAPFHTAMGTRHGDQFLSQMDLIKAAESHGIRFLVLNDSCRDVSHLFTQRLIPTDGEPEYRYCSVRAFEKSEPLDDVDVLFDQVDELIEHGAQAAKPDPIRQTSEIDLYGIRSPSARRLERQARRLQRRLQNSTPGRRVVVRYTLPSERTKEERAERSEETGHDGWFFTHEYQGSLTVMPTLGDNHPNLVVLDAEADQIHAPEFIETPQVMIALVQAMSFEEKVDLLDRELTELGDTARIDPDAVSPEDVAAGQAVVDSILVDLATEQAAILKTAWKPLFFGNTIPESLVQLRFLAEHPFSLIAGSPEQPDVQLAARLIAGIEFLGRSSSQWYESRVFPWGFFRRGPALRNAIRTQKDALVANLFRQPNAGQARRIDEELEGFTAQRRALRTQRKVGKKRAARQVLDAPLSRHAIRTDAGRSFQSVLSRRAWEVVRQAESERESARVALQEKKEEDQEQYAVARDGRPLPNQPPHILRALEPFLDAFEAARAAQQTQARAALKQPAPVIREAAVADDREPPDEMTDMGRTTTPS